MKKFKKRELEKETIELKKEINLYHKEHEKQEKFQNDIHKDKEYYKELYRILTEKYKKLNLQNKELQESFKESCDMNVEKTLEVDRMKSNLALEKRENKFLFDRLTDATKKATIDKKESYLSYFIRDLSNSRALKIFTFVFAISFVLLICELIKM